MGCRWRPIVAQQPRQRWPIRTLRPPIDRSNTARSKRLAGVSSWDGSLRVPCALCYLERRRDQIAEVPEHERTSMALRMNQLRVEGR